ncbi:MAG: UDP-2,3-diacylglucosamine diphosphatase LpxI [Spirochaetia bacterium]|nr:UDP-2,3-diacylglucosamine diphosphatase LpxI [Spirochaetia bacterium]
MKKQICIIAGSGNLPEYAVDEAIYGNLNFSVYFLEEKNIRLAGKLKKNGISFQVVHTGQFDEILKKLKNEKTDEVLIVGKIEKEKILKGIKFSLKTLRLLKQIRNWNDKSIFQLIASEFQKANITILRQDHFLKSLTLNPGIYSRKKPSKTDMENIGYGMEFAKKIAAQDIGQTVVVAAKMLLAVEAIEGTNEAIKRGGHYAHKKTTAVCKAMRKNQDTRFDVPTVGVDTVEIMHQSGCQILAVEAKRTFVMDRELFLKKINHYKMVFVAV